MNEKVADIKCPACKKKAELILNLFINDKGFICNKCKKLIVPFTCPTCGEPFKKRGKTLWCKDCNVSTSTSQIERGLQSLDLLQKLSLKKKQAEEKRQDGQKRLSEILNATLSQRKKGDG